MNATQDRAKSIFLNAVEITAAEERRTFVESQCAGDGGLRAEVDELLQHQQSLGSFLESPVAGFAVTNDSSPIIEGPGTVIGPYKLLEQIGEGGFGVVFLAEQERPVRRRVALKIIKPGMDTRQVIARFEAERQALAMMDHPNIAKVLDAGTTEAGSREHGAVSPDEFVLHTPRRVPCGSLPAASAGRPYFVMELVQGVLITDYCDRCNFTTRQRLELFITVCQAVQHAHQKGVIHRDIKPTNVLVAIQDGRPAAKIIDFGVAKALRDRLTEQTLATGFAQMLGTPMYMSPEQAELSPLGVDTRSDIYSLGVLLYELLTGTTPFDKDRFHSASYDELRRIIREEEPPRPSTRLSSLSLRSKTRRGEERDGVRETANLATTIAKHHRTDPRRLVQSIRGDLDWIVMKCLDKDRNRRYETASALTSDVSHYLNDEPVCAAAPSHFYRIGKFVRRNKWPVIAASALVMGLVAGIIGMANALISQSRQRAEAQLNLANSLQSQRKYADAEALFRAGLESASSATAEDRQRLARTRLGLAKVVYDRGNAAESERLYHEALLSFRAAFRPGDPNIAHALTSFALLLHAQRRYADAEPLFREAYDIYRRARPADNFVIGVSARYLASILISLGRYAEAEPILRDAIAHHQLADPPDEWALAIARIEFARNLISTGKFPEAEAELIEAERALISTSDFRYGIFALTALYTVWDQAEPGEGYDTKAREWYRKHIETFVRPDALPRVGSESQQRDGSDRQ